MNFEFDAFLSHSSQDKPRVRRLAERLREVGIRIWFDEWAIEPGQDIFLAIERALQTARVQLLCMSPAAFGSDWVGLERSTALFRDPNNTNRRFIPLLLSDCALPDLLRRYKYVDFRKDTEAAFQELLFALNPELAAAYVQGSDSIQRFLSAEQQASIVLNEAKLIVVGEGDVGKSRLLDALSDEEWIEDRPKARGVEIKAISLLDEQSRKEITLNAWDFGGQQIYRATHQMFFTTSALYLVVWKPREGSQQGMVKEWISLIKRRAADARIIVIATFAGPLDRQPDLNRQEIWDEFGKDAVVDFLHVDSKPDARTGERRGIETLKRLLVRLALAFPEMERTVPANWQVVRKRLQEHPEPSIPHSEFLEVCRENKIVEKDARLFIAIEHRLGRLIYYGHDPILASFVILRPNWVAAAISFVFSDKAARDSLGLVTLTRLSELWNDPTRDSAFRYDAIFHPVFLRLMERFELCFRVNELYACEWPNGKILVAELLSYDRPDLSVIWLAAPKGAEKQQVQICRIVVEETGLMSPADGLFPQLIVRLHKFSWGRWSDNCSVHWQRGMVLKDEYGSNALLEYVGYDVRITVRAPYPERFLAILTHEVKSIIESEKRWHGLRCDIMVPCLALQDGGMKCKGMFEVAKLIKSRLEEQHEYPCPECNVWQEIDSLLLNAHAARPNPIEELLADFVQVRQTLGAIRGQVAGQHAEIIDRFDQQDANAKELVSKVEAAYDNLMHMLVDEAKEGPRLFSFEPAELGFFDRPKWISAKFRVTLWCEHSRRPLPTLNGNGDKRGVYELNLPRDWFVKAAPFLKILTGTLSLVVPVALSATKLIMDDAAYKGIEAQLDLGQKSLESVLKGGEQASAWLGRSDAPDLERGEAIEAHGAVLRQLQSWLKEKDPGFGGLVRVQNKRQEFVWVHPQFEKEY